MSTNTAAASTAAGVCSTRTRACRNSHTCAMRCVTPEKLAVVHHGGGYGVACLASIPARSPTGATETNLTPVANGLVSSCAHHAMQKQLCRANVQFCTKLNGNAVHDAVVVTIKRKSLCVDSEEMAATIPCRRGSHCGTRCTFRSSTHSPASMPSAITDSAACGITVSRARRERSATRMRTHRSLSRRHGHHLHAATRYFTSWSIHWTRPGTSCGPTGVNQM
jgi:hypothetical protein